MNTSNSEKWVSGADFKFKTPVRDRLRLTMASGKVRSPVNTRRRATLVLGRNRSPLLHLSDEEVDEFSTTSFYQKTTRNVRTAKKIAEMQISDQASPLPTLSRVSKRVAAKSPTKGPTVKHLQSTVVTKRTTSKAVSSLSPVSHKLTRSTTSIPSLAVSNEPVPKNTKTVASKKSKIPSPRAMSTRRRSMMTKAESNLPGKSRLQIPSPVEEVKSRRAIKRGMGSPLISTTTVTSPDATVSLQPKSGGLKVKKVKEKGPKQQVMACNFSKVKLIEATNLSQSIITVVSSPKSTTIVLQADVKQVEKKLTKTTKSVKATTTATSLEVNAAKIFASPKKVAAETANKRALITAKTLGVKAAAAITPQVDDSFKASPPKMSTVKTSTKKSVETMSPKVGSVKTSATRLGTGKTPKSPKVLKTPNTPKTRTARTLVVKAAAAAVTPEVDASAETASPKVSTIVTSTTKMRTAKTPKSLKTAVSKTPKMRAAKLLVVNVAAAVTPKADDLVKTVSPDVSIVITSTTKMRTTKTPKSPKTIVLKTPKTPKLGAAKTLAVNKAVAAVTPEADAAVETVSPKVGSIKTSTTKLRTVGRPKSSKIKVSKAAKSPKTTVLKTPKTPKIRAAKTLVVKSPATVTPEIDAAVKTVSPKVGNIKTSRTKLGTAETPKSPKTKVLTTFKSPDKRAVKTVTTPNVSAVKTRKTANVKTVETLTAGKVKAGKTPATKTFTLKESDIVSPLDEVLAKMATRKRRSVPNPVHIVEIIEKKTSTRGRSVGVRRKSTSGIVHGDDLLLTIDKESAASGEFMPTAAKISKTDQRRKTTKIARKPTPNRTSTVSRVRKMQHSSDFAAGDHSLLYLTPEVQSETRRAGHTPYHTPLMAGRSQRTFRCSPESIDSSMKYQDNSLISADESLISNDGDSSVDSHNQHESQETPSAAKSWCSVM